MPFRNSLLMSLAATGLAVGGLLASPSAATAQPQSTQAPSDCPKGYFCGYKDPNYKHLAFRFKDCYMQEIPDGLNSGGSWFNNQTDGTQTGMYGKHKELVYITPGAPYGDPHGDWAPVWYVWNYC